jgi:hypothetical protein
MSNAEKTSTIYSHECCGCGGLCDVGHPCPMAYACECRAEPGKHPAAREEYWDAPQDPGHTRAMKWGFFK